MEKTQKTLCQVHYIILTCGKITDIFVTTKNIFYLALQGHQEQF